MSTKQRMPKDLSEKQLRLYANTFFGFGCWDAPYWIINLEEKGATTRDEFVRRYLAWQQMGSGSLVDLRNFAGRCGIPLEWKNSTWKASHDILSFAGIHIGPLSQENTCWGGSCVALIEAMPFPATTTKEWPYSNWNFEFMQTREASKVRFRNQRAELIIEKVRQHKPKWVIDCGKVWTTLKARYGVKFADHNGRYGFHSAKFDGTLWVSPKQFGRWISNEVRQQMANLWRQNPV